MLGRALARRGHEVIWWTASFCHHSKTVRSAETKDIHVEPGFTIRLVPAPPYRRHVGFARLRFEFLFALRFYRMARRCEAPDSIVSADATMAWTQACLTLARHFDVDLVYDIIDLYPEVFTGALPSWLRSYQKLVFWPFYALRNQHLRKASAVTAVCDDYLNPARLANPSLSNDRMLTVFWGTDLKEFRKAQGDAAQIAEHARKLGKREGDVFAIYAGTLGVLYDIDALLDAARLLKANSRLKILIAGGGPRAADIREFATRHELNNLVILGEVGFAELIRLYQVCDIGLSIYGVNSPVAMPIKVFDYFAAGLPVVNSIGGFLERLLGERRIGVQYKAGDSQSLAAALDRLGSDDETRRAMVENAKAAAEEFDSALQYGRFVDLLERLAKTRSALRRNEMVSDGELQLSRR
jgi:glycosyltransferase involved in cell wall biosynthesis